MGRVATVVGIAVSRGGGLPGRAFNNIMDLLQLVFGFVNAPLFATFLLGMFWKRATGHGAFFGLLAGTLAAALHHGLTLPPGQSPGSRAAGSAGAAHVPERDGAELLDRDLGVDDVLRGDDPACRLVTGPRPDEDLKGLVYSLTPRPEGSQLPWNKRPAPLAAVVLTLP